MNWDDLQQRWGSLSVREQKTLIAGGTFLVLLLLWWGLLRPLLAYQQELHRKAESLSEQLEWMQQQAPRLAGARQQPTLSGQGTPAEIASASARQLGISISRVQPKGQDAVSLWVDEVPAKRLLQWLKELQQQGLVVSNAQISKVSDGMLRATLTLSRGMP
jgi:general secretion pathway protein M